MAPESLAALLIGCKKTHLPQKVTFYQEVAVPVVAKSLATKLIGCKKHTSSPKHIHVYNMFTMASHRLLPLLPFLTPTGPRLA